MNRAEQLYAIALSVAENEAAAKKYADHLESLFDVILPERIGDAFAEAVRAEDYHRAVALCADCYRTKAAASVSELSAEESYHEAIADNAAAGVMREINIDWSFPDGEVDYLFDPTAIHGPRNHEWLWQFNRHSYWKDMARAYVATGDEKYAVAFRRQLLKWIAQTDIPEKWNDPGSAWRTIECGLRLLGSWQVAFDGFRRSKSVEDVTLLLMIASMHKQSLHLVAHPTGGNWLMMESNGVYTFSALFDELSDSKQNREIATERLFKEMQKQILPDGMHNELSPDYQSVVFHCAVNYYGLAVSLGKGGEIPPAFVELIESTTNAAILLSTPALTQPRTNDTYTIPTKRFTSRTEALIEKKPEYVFVNTNRHEGAPPIGDTASVYLPYAGFAVMRSDWSGDATYLCFDVGPLGTGHMHQDKLNIILYKGDEELLYDDGGGQYEISRARSYGLSGYSHNTVLVDGRAQDRRAPLQSTEPIDACWITNEQFDYACATYEDDFGGDHIKPAVHKREVRFCKPGFFCVSDTLTSTDGNPHRYDLLFHLDTTRVKPLPEYKNGMISDFGRKYELVMIPIDEHGERVVASTVSAQTEPYYQGWYNGRNESNLHEAITVMRRVDGLANTRFTTLLFPVATGGEMPDVVRDENGMIRVTFEGKSYILDLNNLNQ
ncbi:MAG: alginate lyase family protein [Clostridia bacterium]|nr:alginate lyase family protein [Clostridia bacterium]